MATKTPATLRGRAPAHAPARRLAPITQGDIVTFLRKSGMHRDQVTVSDFERGKYRGTDEFVAMYAKAIGSTPEAVNAAWISARRVWLRKAKAGSRRGR